MTTSTLILITIISLAISFFCLLALLLKPVTQEQLIGVTFIFFSLVSGFGYYSILRAGLNVIRRPEIYIFDDSFSALDYKSFCIHFRFYNNSKF